MKKKLIVSLLCLTLLSLLGGAALAYELSPAPEMGTLVIDTAGLFTQSERAALEERAQSISESYQCDTLIVTVPDLGEYSFSWELSEALFTGYSLGYGAERSCVLLLLSMEERDFDLMAYGYGNTAFTDYGKAALEERFLPFFRQDDWAGGFDAYLSGCAELLSAAREGVPVDVDTDPARLAGERETMRLTGLVGGGVLALLAAFITCAIFKAQMKTARKAETAENYITGQGLRLTERQDIFLHATRTRQKIETQKSTGGHGGTSINSGGFSHRSGKF